MTPRQHEHRAIKHCAPLVTSAPAPLPEVAPTSSADRSAALMQGIRTHSPTNRRGALTARATVVKSVEEQVAAQVRREQRRGPSVPVVVARPNRSKERAFAEAAEKKRKNWLQRKSESSLGSWEERHAMEAGCAPSRSRTSDRAIRYDLVRRIVNELLAALCDGGAGREGGGEEDKDKSQRWSTVGLEDVRAVLDGIKARITRGVASATIIQLCQSDKGWLALHVHDAWEVGMGW